MSQSSPSIVILGGGFGGLHTALRLCQFPWPDAAYPDIVLVDQNRHFLFLPLLYEKVTGELESWEIAPSFADLLANTPVQFKQGTVNTIDLDHQSITLDSGETLRFDRLVLALGGETPLNRVPGAANHALPFHTLADADRLRDRLAALEASDQAKIRIVVAGGGPSGVELACKLADRLGKRGRIRLVERNDRLLKQSPQFNQTAARQALDRRGVWIDLETSIQSVAQDSVVLTYKDQADTIPIDLVLWTVGSVIAPLVRDLPVPHAENGRLQTDVTLHIVDHPTLFALGDLADCRDANNQPVPTTAQAAIQQADCMAWNIWASLNQRPLLPFRYLHLGEMLTLGTDTAALSGLGVTLDGPFAVLARRLIYLYRMPTLDHQLKVGLNWMLKPLWVALQSQT